MQQSLMEYPEEFQSYDDSGAGVVQEDDYSGSPQEPFDPTKIRMSSRVVSLDKLIKRLEYNELNLSPDFQREKDLWDDSAQSRLIESLLIRIPIPAFYFDATDEDKWVVIDGVQRLTAFARFVMDEETLAEQHLKLPKLVLEGLEFLTDLNHKKFEDLSRADQRSIEETDFTIYTIAQGTPSNVKYNIFKRINTGGLPLSDQEIRNAFHAGKATKFLNKLAKSDEFLNIIRHITTGKRGEYEEFILCFIAFTLPPTSEYKKNKKPDFDKLLEEYEKLGFDKFLNSAMAQINTMSYNGLTELEQKFKKAMVAAHEIFGEHAFRTNKVNNINRALFEVWSVKLGQLTDKDVQKLIEKKGYLTDLYFKLLSDSKFKNAVAKKKARGVNQVNTRFRRVAEIIERCLYEIDPWKNKNIEIEDKYPIGSTVNVRLINYRDFGVFAELEDGVNGLIHIDELSWAKRGQLAKKFFEDNSKERVKVVVLKVDPVDRRIALSYKRTEPDPWERIPKEYKVGSVIRGKIYRVIDSGALAELEDDIDGFIHISELASIVSVGEEYDLKVIKLDVNARRIGLSLKAVTEPDPWERIPEKYKVGSVVRGKIRRFTDFGAFAELEDGVDGLIHISELASRRIETPQEVVSVGEEYDLEVIELDVNARRIGLSLKAVSEEQSRQGGKRRAQPPRRQHSPRNNPTIGGLIQEEQNKKKSKKNTR